VDVAEVALVDSPRGSRTLRNGEYSESDGQHECLHGLRGGSTVICTWRSTATLLPRRDFADSVSTYLPGSRSFSGIRVEYPKPPFLPPRSAESRVSSFLNNTRPSSVVTVAVMSTLCGVVPALS